MNKISWSEFIIVWLLICVVIDIVLIYLNKKSENKGVFALEERTKTIKQLYTPYIDDVVYEAPLRRASMTKVLPLILADATEKSDIFQTNPNNARVDDKVEDEKVEDEKVELTELQQETSDIVKMLFG